MSTLIIVGVVPWEINPNEPRHNNIHHSIYSRISNSSIESMYIGPKQPAGNDWIEPLLPQTVHRNSPAISPRAAISIASGILASQSEQTSIFMYEGSLRWMWNLVAIGRLVGAERVVCNLFPPSKVVSAVESHFYYRIWFKAQLKLAQVLSNGTLVCTVDTELASQKLPRIKREPLEIFPLVSALKELDRKKYLSQTHNRVLLNVRDLDLDELSKMLSESCKDCSFVLPRGPISSHRLSQLMNNHRNLIQDEKNIPEEEYEDYIDSFDYMIFLYKPNIDSSGKLLDAFARQIPVCLPEESEDFIKLAARSVDYKTYSWKSRLKSPNLFLHPEFVRVRKISSEEGIKELRNFLEPKSEFKTIKSNVFLGVLISSLVYLIFQTANFTRKIMRK